MSRFDEVSEWLERALRLKGEPRQQFIDRIDDEELREEVRRLAAAEDEADAQGFFRPTEVSPMDAVPKVGQQLGPFTIVRELGRGGMGIVFLAHDSGIGQEVALKVLHPLLWSDEEARRELLHEAEMIRRVRHDAIVPLLRHVEADGWTMLVYRYIDGPSLKDEIEALHERGRSKRWTTRNDVVRELLPIARGLAHAHDQGVWHRDIKPSNILLENEGHAYLADFGLAKDGMDPQLTRSGLLKGSIPYMSPEQARAKLKLVDHRSDLFSFGVVLFEALSGKHPFDDGSDQDLIEKIAHREALLLREKWPGAPESLTAICSKLLRNRPEERYGSAHELVDDLEAHLDGRKTKARLPNLFDRLWRQRGKILASMIAIAVVVGAVVIGRTTILDHMGSAEVTLSSDPPNARVWVQTFDLELSDFGPPMELGRTPMTTRVPGGMHRFRFVADDVHRAELTRRWDVSEIESPEFDLHAVLVEPDTTGMVLIPGGEFLASLDPPTPEEYMSTFTTDAFWIDRHEVTNAQYLRFVEATGHPRPTVWDVAPPERFPDLPVAVDLIADARAYAEWVGKRLPTRLEWERAARGTDGREYPWGPEALDFESWRISVCGARVSTEERRNKAVGFSARLYPERLAPVETHPLDRSPDGVSDMAGSLSEWVDAVPTDLVDGRVQPAPEAVAKGFNWFVESYQWVFTATITVPRLNPAQDPQFGFRCAMSAKSPPTP